jgi:hypothetical protein
MVQEQLQPLKELDDLEQAVYSHARARVRSLRDITRGLFRSLVLPLDHGNFVAAQLGARTQPITVVLELEISDTSPSGVVWEIGSSAQGAGLSFDAGVLRVGAGNATGTTGVATSLSGLSDGQRFQVAVAINPGTRRIGVYIDGHLEAFADGALAFPSGEYSDSGAGRVNGVNGTVTPRLVAATALTDVAIVSPVSIYVGQLPRGFQA